MEFVWKKYVYSEQCSNCGNNEFQYVEGSNNQYACTACGRKIVIMNKRTNAYNPGESLFKEASTQLINRRFTEAISLYNEFLAMFPNSSEGWFGKCLAENRCSSVSELSEQKMINKYLSVLMRKYPNRYDLSQIAIKELVVQVLGSSWNRAYRSANSDKLDFYNEILEDIINAVDTEYNKITLDMKGKEYNNTVSMFFKCETINDYKELEQMFVRLGNYSHAKEYADKCRRK